MTSTDEILGQFSAIQTLIENFPMGILDKIHGKTYTSVFDFLVDLFSMCGISINDVMSEMISELLEIPIDLDGDIADIQEKIENGTIIGKQSAFLTGLETSVKSILKALLTSVFTCSALPIIPNRNLDTYINPATKENKALLVIPKSSMDPFGILDICPTSSEGQYYYSTNGKTTYYQKIHNDNDDSYEYTSCNYDDVDFSSLKRVTCIPTSEITKSSPEYLAVYKGENPNLLYQSFDMNAFIWYVINKGSSNPQVEKNHMMWDSRLYAANESGLTFSGEEKNFWYNSKTAITEYFSAETNTEEVSQVYYPILQLEPSSTPIGIKVSFPFQRYGNKLYKNKVNLSVYHFNNDYLDSIQIFHPLIILRGMIEEMLGFTMILTANMSLSKKIIRSKISTAIKNIITANDMEVEDCYMTFSNEEFDEMLQEMLLEKYTATKYGTEENVVRVHDTEKYLNEIDAVNSASKSEGTTTQITKLVTDVTANIGSSENSVSYGISLNTDNNILYKMLWALSMPIIESIFTPQVITLILINYSLFGMVSLDGDLSKILNLIFNKILGLAKSIILYIKDKIIEILINYLYNTLLPMLLKYQALLLLEQLNSWLELLIEAASCVPLFRLSRRDKSGEIDDVDYADITTTQETPESDSSC